MAFESRVRGPKRDGLTVSLEIRSALQQLNRLDQKTKKKIARKVVRSSARPILKDAKVRVPVDTGDLKRSLTIRTSVKRFRAEARVQATEPYAHLVEAGTLPHDQEKLGRRHPGAEPRPYLRPAYDTHKDEAVGIARRLLKAEIDKVTRKGAR